MATVPPTVGDGASGHACSLRPQASSTPIRRSLPQTGSVSEADYEALVLKLHEIQVRGGWAAAAAPAVALNRPCSVQQHQ